MHGEGTFYYYSGAIYIGQFENNKKHGNGKFVNNNHEITYIGLWEYD